MNKKKIISAQRRGILTGPFSQHIDLLLKISSHILEFKPEEKPPQGTRLSTIAKRYLGFIKNIRCSESDLTDAQISRFEELSTSCRLKQKRKLDFSDVVDYIVSETKFRKVLQVFDEPLIASYKWVAECFFQVGDFEKAGEYIKKACKLQDIKELDRALWCVKWGVDQFSKKKWLEKGDIRKLSDMFCQISPFSKFSEKDLDDVVRRIDSLDAIKQSRRQFLGVLYDAGLVCLRKKDYEGAEKIFRALLRSTVFKDDKPFKLFIAFQLRNTLLSHSVSFEEKEDVDNLCRAVMRCWMVIKEMPEDLDKVFLVEPLILLGRLFDKLGQVEPDSLDQLTRYRDVLREFEGWCQREGKEMEGDNTAYRFSQDKTSRKERLGVPFTILSDLVSNDGVLPKNARSAFEQAKAILNQKKGHTSDGNLKEILTDKVALIDRNLEKLGGTVRGTEEFERLGLFVKPQLESIVRTVFDLVSFGYIESMVPGEGGVITMGVDSIYPIRNLDPERLRNIKEFLREVSDESHLCWDDEALESYAKLTLNVYYYLNEEDQKTVSILMMYFYSLDLLIDNNESKDSESKRKVELLFTAIFSVLSGNECPEEMKGTFLKGIQTFYKRAKQFGGDEGLWGAGFLKCLEDTFSGGKEQVENRSEAEKGMGFDGFMKLRRFIGAVMPSLLLGYYLQGVSSSSLLNLAILNYLQEQSTDASSLMNCLNTLTREWKTDPYNAVFQKAMEAPGNSVSFAQPVSQEGEQALRDAQCAVRDRYGGAFFNFLGIMCLLTSEDVAHENALKCIQTISAFYLSGNWESGRVNMPLLKE